MNNNYLEIERKFLLDLNNIPYDLSRMDKNEIVQGYILYNPEVRIRSEHNNQYYMMIKALTEESITRKEITFNISQNAYEQLISRQDVKVIKKDRYDVIEDGRKMEIDVFKENLSGLAYLEVEFKSEKEARAFSIPYWVEREITDDMRYRNSSLARYSLPEQ